MKALRQLGQEYFITYCTRTRLGDILAKLLFSPPTIADWALDVASDVEPGFIIKPFIPTDNLILLSGQPKDGKKTWFAMLTALVAATGQSIGPLVADKAVPVLYIYREGARKPTLNRFEALVEGHGFPRVQGINNLYFHHRGNFWLDDGDCVADTCAFIREKKIKLVYIDTFAKSVSSDENSSRDMGVAVQQAEKLRDAGATVVLVHHLKKGTLHLSNGRSGFPDPDKDIRGSSSLAGAYETHWAVRGYPGPNSRIKETSLLLLGKETEGSQYSYDWEFISEPGNDGDQILRAVRLDIERIGPLQHIEGPKEPRGRGSDSDDF